MATNPATRLRLLLVDDDVVDRIAARRALAASDLDAELVEADDAEAARAALRAAAFDCVLLDLRMPKTDGLALLRALRADGENVPVVMLTGQGDEQTAVEIMKAGALDYIPKAAVTPARLAQSLRHVLRVRDAEVRAETARRELAASEQRFRLLAEALERERQRVEEANRAKDVFLAMVSHELRTPLTAMLGWLKMLRSGMLAEDKRDRALETVERNARAQARLVEDLLDVSRVIAGKLHLETAPVDLADVVAAAVESVRPSANARGVALESRVDRAAGWMHGDANRLAQVVTNLLTNAVKFTPADGRVAIELARVGRYFELVVQDTGRGIRADFLPRLFEPFLQAEAADAHSRGGLGLGLAIVRQLVELHGGTVEAASEGDGRGARFVVRLPRPVDQGARTHAGPHAALGAAGTAHGVLGGLRVLVVDDEVDGRDVLAAVLAEHDADVSSVGSAAEALEAIARTRPDVIVSDVAMPDGSGYDLIRAVRRLGADRGGATPAIALTALARAEDRVLALAAGFTSHVAKPIDPGELVVVVASVAGRLAPHAHDATARAPG